MHSLLIKQCSLEDRKAQGELFKIFAPTLLGLCRRYANNNEEAEEILMNAFAKIFKHITTYRAEGNFEGWMKRICIREALNYQKKFKLKWTRVSLMDSDNPHEAETYNETEELLNTLQKLPKGYRTVFNLHAIEGYKHKEISEMLNISDNTSKSQYKKAKEMLQKMCKHEYRR